MKANILIVDDDPDILAGLETRLTWLGHEVFTCETGTQALSYLKNDVPDVVLLDLELPEQSGMDVLRHLASPPLSPTQSTTEKGKVIGKINIPIIVLTAHGTIDLAVEAMKLGAYDFLTKPFEKEHLSLVIEKALERQSLRQQIQHLQTELNGKYSTIIGNSPKIKEVLELAQRIAPSNTTILLQGETGTGKELFARTIHRWSQRTQSTFMAINCAALPETLLENELFGHEKGAFTGAHSMQPGKLEASNGGTVFLDEIGDMPIMLQARLLRVLETQEFHRVGGVKVVRINVRFIVATNKDLPKAIENGTFREDIYYRINGLTITLPPLRERIEDLPQLVEWALQKQSVSMKRGTRKISEVAFQELSQYHWPGNIRELENVIGRAVLLCPSEEITDGYFGITQNIPASNGNTQDRGIRLSYSESLEHHSRLLILDALRKHDWNKTRAAEELQIQRTYLLRLLKQKGISAEPPTET